MKSQPAPLNVADAAAALRCIYNGEMSAIVRAGVVRFPAQALFTINDPACPAHAATFSIPADNLTPDTLQNAFNNTTTRFASALA